jgi:hypothetical protein
MRAEIGGNNMSSFHFTEQRRRQGGITYDIITSWTIPALSFPNREAAAAWQDASDHFTSEMTRFRDLDIVLVEGQRVYFFQYTYDLANWLYETALYLGATADDGRYPETNNPEPFIQEQPEQTKQPEQPQAITQAAKGLEKAVDETKEMLG